MIEFNFSGCTALVTGGSQGIGLAIARRLAQAGAEVHITGTRESSEDYEGDLSGLHYHRLRLQSEEERREVCERFAALDILINNAGMASDDEYTMSGFHRVMDVNLNAVADICFQLKPLLASTKGAIVNIGSCASFLGIRRQPAYTASKAALLGFTRAIADEWIGDGVRVNMLAPGFVETRIIQSVADNPAASDGAKRAIPARRFGRPDEIATAVLFLASENASYIVGQSLVVDGGLMLR